MKIKTSQILMLLNVLSNAKLTKATAQDKAALIKLTVALRREGKAWNDLLEEARNRCKPDNFDELSEKQGRLDTLEAGERKAVQEALAKYTAEVEEIVAPEFAAEREIGVEPFGEDALVRLADSNPEWTLGDIMAVCDCLSGE